MSFRVCIIHQSHFLGELVIYLFVSSSSVFNLRALRIERRVVRAMKWNSVVGMSSSSSIKCSSLKVEG